MEEKSQKTLRHTWAMVVDSEQKHQQKPGPNPEPGQIQPLSQGLRFPSSCAAILRLLPTSQGWFLHRFLYTCFSSVGFNQRPKTDDLVHQVLPLRNLCGAAAPVNWIKERCTSYFLVMLRYHNCRFARLVSRQLKR